jgi:hypothetical protein
METRMAAIPRVNQTKQLALFGERVAVPRWCDLTEYTRAEVVRLLSQLLVSVRKGNQVRVPPTHGGRDE